MNKIEKFLLLTLLCSAFASGLLGPLYAIFAENIGGDILDISWAWALYLIISGSLTILVGKWSDKHNKNPLIIFGFVITTISTFSYLLVNKPLDLFFVQIGLGIGSALIWPIWDTLYALNQDEKEIGNEWGLAEGAWDLIAGIGLITGGYLVNEFGFSAVFISMGILQLIGLICVIISLIYINKK